MKSDSTIASAISGSLIHFLWQGFLIGFVVYILLKCIRKESCEKRYLVAAAGLTFMPLSFLYTLRIQFQQTVAGSLNTGVSQYPSFDLNIIFFLWLSGVLFFALRLALKIRAGKKLRSQQTTRPKEAWKAVFDELIGALKLSPSIRFLESVHVSTPMVLGTLSPVVLVPLGFMSGLSALEIKAILAHELAHIRRHDHLFNLFQECIEVCFFFHPVTWIISSTLRKEREYCCDRIAVRLTGDPLILARSLSFMESCRRYTTHGLCGNGGPLKSRIKRLLNQDNPKENTMKNTKKVILCSTLFFSAAIGLIISSRATAKEEANSHMIFAKDIPQAPVWEEVANMRKSETQVQLSTRFFQMKENHPATMALSIQYAKAADDDTDQVTVITFAEAEALFKTLSQTTNSDLLIAPSIISRMGETSSIKITRPLAVIEDQNGIDTVKEVNLGVTTNYRPVISTDRKQINLDLFAQILELDPALDKTKAQKNPKFSCLTFETNLDIPFGSVAVVGKKHKDNSTLLMMVTPELQAKGKE